MQEINIDNTKQIRGAGPGVVIIGGLAALLGLGSLITWKWPWQWC